MSTGNEPALPTPIDNQQPAAEGAAAAQAAAAPETLVVDVDDIELNDAKAAAQAEEAGGQGDVTNGAATGDVTGQQQQQAAPKDQQHQQQAPAPAADAVMIPKPRLDEALGRATKAEQQAAYWQGVAEARAQQQPAPQGGQQQQAPAQATPEQRLAEIATAVDAIAKQFDDGEITLAQFKAQERTLQGQEHAIREESLLARVPKQQAAPAQTGSDPLYLETLTAQLEQQHPWVAVFDQVGTDRDWDYLKDRAIENLTARGIDPTKGDLGRFELRKEIAQLADELGATLVGKRAETKGITLPGAQPPAQQQQQQQRQQPTAADARLAALRKAENAPPDISALAGTSGGDPGMPSEGRLETMSDEEISALPAGVRNRLKGIAA